MTRNSTNNKKRMTRIGRGILIVFTALMAWQVARLAFLQEERAMRSELRQTIETTFPTLAEAARERYRLIRLTAAQPGRDDIVLVHGVDDPGKVWMNLAPALSAQGFGVSVMNYPNDQPIHDSAQLFADALQAAPMRDVPSVSIVAHSMGGLVSRELLTHPKLVCSPPACRRPHVDRLIMVGTPNHGSHLARLRELGEAREQLYRIFTGQAGWFDGYFDGAGEAGIDLLPDSVFLTDLNARPHPADTQMYVIAGVMGLEEAQQLADLFESAPDENGLRQPLPLAESIGDGLVSFDSARLDDVPLYRVPGNHLSIVRNVNMTSDRVPPALPIVFDLLGGEAPAID